MLLASFLLLMIALIIPYHKTRHVVMGYATVSFVLTLASGVIFFDEMGAVTNVGSVMYAISLICLLLTGLLFGKQKMANIRLQCLATVAFYVVSLCGISKLHIVAGHEIYVAVTAYSDNGYRSLISGIAFLAASQFVLNVTPSIVTNATWWGYSFHCVLLLFAAQAIDSVIFFTLAFYNQYKIFDLLVLLFEGCVFKIWISMLSMPIFALSYLFLKMEDHIDVGYDRDELLLKMKRMERELRHTERFEVLNGVDWVCAEKESGDELLP